MISFNPPAAIIWSCRTKYFPHDLSFKNHKFIYLSSIYLFINLSFENHQFICHTFLTIFLLKIINQSIYLFIYLSSIYLFIVLSFENHQFIVYLSSIYLFIYQSFFWKSSIYLFIYLSIYLSIINLFIYLFIYQSFFWKSSIYLFVYHQFIYLSIFLLKIINLFVTFSLYPCFEGSKSLLGELTCCNVVVGRFGILILMKIIFFCEHGMPNFLLLLFL